MEAGESIYQTVRREYLEETGLLLRDPELRGVFTILVEEQGQVIQEWMMFSFVALSAKGEPLVHSPEGELLWWPLERLHQLSLPQGDRLFLPLLLERKSPLIGTFRYTPDYQTLLAYDWHNITEEIGLL